MHRSILRGLAAIALAVALVAALVPASGPAAAGQKHDPLEGLTLHPEWGSVTGHGGVLRRGCRMYSYSYDIDPPEGIWAIEIFVSGPGLKALAAGAFMGDYDPKNGTGQFKLCRVTTRYGRFTIEAKVSADDGTGKIIEGRLPADHFRLRRPHR